MKCTPKRLMAMAAIAFIASASLCSELASAWWTKELLTTYPLYGYVITSKLLLIGSLLLNEFLKPKPAHAALHIHHRHLYRRFRRAAIDDIERSDSDAATLQFAQRQLDHTLSEISKDDAHRHCALKAVCYISAISMDGSDAVTPAERSVADILKTAIVAGLDNNQEHQSNDKYEASQYKRAFQDAAAKAEFGGDCGQLYAACSGVSEATIGQLVRMTGQITQQLLLSSRQQQQQMQF